MLLNTQKRGDCLAFPDVCKTPPANLPIPYPNRADARMSRPGCYFVLVQNAPAHNLRTQCMVTLGDTPGTTGGLISQSFMREQQYIYGCESVQIGGKPATRWTSITRQNKGNAFGLRITPSQNFVWLLGP